MIEIVPIQKTHLRPVMKRVRKPHEDDARTLLNCGAAKSMVKSLRKSVAAWTVLENGSPECLFGVAPDGTYPNCGIIWMFGTERVVARKRVMIEEGPRMMGEMKKLFPVLRAYVTAYNPKSVIMLSHWGFSEVSRGKYNDTEFVLMENAA